MAADTKGLLVFIPGTSFFARFVNFVIASFIYVFVSEKVASSTGALTSWMSQSPSKKATAAVSGSSTAYTPLSTSEDTQGGEKMGIIEPTQALTRTARLVDTLGSSLKFRMLAIIVVLWVMNLLYPSESPPDGHLVRHSHGSKARRELTELYSCLRIE